MVVKITKPSGKAVIEKALSKKGTKVSEETTQEDVAPAESEPVEGSPCVVNVGLSFTQNLGDYNSLKMSVSLAMPCKHAEIDEVYDYVKEWVETKLNGLVEENKQ